MSPPPAHDHHAPVASGSCCHGHAGSDARDGNATKDPVCGMQVNPHATPHHLVHGGQTYHFCSARCREAFATDPSRYVHPAPEPVTDAMPAGTIYTCPMHPQIR